MTVADRVLDSLNTTCPHRLSRVFDRCVQRSDCVRSSRSCDPSGHLRLCERNDCGKRARVPTRALGRRLTEEASGNCSTSNRARGEIRRPSSFAIRGHRAHANAAPNAACCTLLAASARFAVFALPSLSRVRKARRDRAHLASGSRGDRRLPACGSFLRRTRRAMRPRASPSRNLPGFAGSPCRNGQGSGAQAPIASAHGTVRMLRIVSRRRLQVVPMRVSASTACVAPLVRAPPRCELASTSRAAPTR